MTEPLKSEPHERSIAPAKLGGESFVTFWGAYPKRKDKIAAERAWKRAIRLASPDVIVAGARRYRDDPERIRAGLQYTKLPATWLNAGAWLDEVPPSVRSLPEPQNLSLRYDQEPEGITFKEFRERYADEHELEVIERNHWLRVFA